MGETKKVTTPDQGEQPKHETNPVSSSIPQQKGAERISLTENHIQMIPAELKQEDHWVLVKLEERKGKLTKVPYTDTRYHADTTNPNTWTSFQNALDAYRNSNGYFNGIGYVFSANDPFTGIDLDKCIIEGKLTDEAKAIVRDLSSYTERSQSKTGVHVIIKGEIPGDRKRSGNIEMYDKERFFWITGDHVGGTPETIEERQDVIDAIYKRVFDKPRDTRVKAATASSGAVMDDDDIISVAAQAKNGIKFSDLFTGDWTRYYGSQSEADMALCNLLAFYTKDAEQIDRLFRRSGLMREKWDREDYSTNTIEEALRAVTEQYQLPRSKTGDAPPRNNVITHPALAERNKRVDKPAFRNTDLGNAERLIYHFGDDLRYCYAFGTWYIWNGKRWCADETGEIERKAKQTVLNMYKEALEEEDDKRVALIKHATKSESGMSLTNMIKWARMEVPVTPAQLDGDQWQLNCENGMIDLRTGELHPHNREEMMTNMVPTEYDPTAECPNWMKFLNRIMQDAEGNDRPRLVEFLQRAVGYSLTGSIKEQAMFVLYGSGKNGKSTFINVVKDLLGDYARQSSTETFMAKQNAGGVPNDIARLKGARLVSAVESEEGKRLAESLIKQMTGGEPITARFLHKEFFEFTPTFKIFFVTNHKPQIKNSDLGIWRRIKLIPFTVTIRPDEDDKSLPDKLREEMPGILRWAVEGCLNWQKDGLQAPEEVTNATNEYRQEMDTMSHFVNDYCIVNPMAKVASKDLYKAYTDWCEESGERPLTQNKFVIKLKERMESHGFPITDSRTGKGRFWNGIGLAEYTNLPDMSDAGDAQSRVSNNVSNHNVNHENSVASVTSVTAGFMEAAAAAQPKEWEVGEL